MEVCKMHQREMENNLNETINWNDLSKLASELRISDYNRMDARQLVEAIVLTRIYRALTQSPEMVRYLTRNDFLRLCDSTDI